MMESNYSLCSGSPYLLVVEFFGLPRLEKLEQVTQGALVVVPERVPGAVPVPAHHTTEQFKGGGRGGWGGWGGQGVRGQGVKQEKSRCGELGQTNKVYNE